MCSFLFSTKLPTTEINIDFVNEHLKYRGPDSTNHIIINNHFFLHNLLSITGQFTVQPLIDNNQVCLFNGEIYNFKDFGDYDNDGKCLIPLYKKHGYEFIKQLDGDFAVVLIDYDSKIIIVSTDIFGTKPIFISTIDGVGIATYSSALQRLGFQNIEKIKANTTLVLNFNGEVISKTSIKTFDLNQHKNSYDDFFNAISYAINKRALRNVREKIFIGLSSGYDSGTFCCNLMKQNIPFKAYSVMGPWENHSILHQRYKLFHEKFELETTYITPEMNKIAHDYLVNHTCDWKYTVYTNRSNYNEFDLSLKDDNGSKSLSHLLSLAKADNRKIMLETIGADEIFSDYGWNGVSKYNHSNFGGLFPENLSKIYPWPSFFESTLESYLMKAEFVGGSYGLEVRYPFLDPVVIQEFLWLSCELKNRKYKAPLDEYLTINNFPFAPGEKWGF